MFEKYEGNPILKPISEHSWESKCVFNPAVFYDGGKIHIVYRAIGDDNISRLGYASSFDGFKIDERLPEPIFIPEGEYELRGCEDPRITKIDEEYYMFYTAFDGKVAQIGQVAIKRNDFIAHKWSWGKRIYPFPRVNNKDVVLFPEKIKDKWVIYHRIPPHVWVAYSDDLVHWKNSNIVIMPRDNSWENEKVGAGAPPTKTPRGWLFIYHAMSKDKIYRLGLVLIDPKDPEQIIYRSKDPILVPDKEYERIGDVTNVVFTCGAFLKGTRLFLYYGGADTVICVATQKLRDILPE